MMSTWLICCAILLDALLFLELHTTHFVRACAIARRTPNPITSLNYFFSPTEFANKTWKIHSYIPSDNVLKFCIIQLNVRTQGLWYNGSV